MRRENLRKVAIAALVLTVVSMPYSVQVCHWSYVVFIACWIADWNWQQKWSTIVANKAGLLLPAFFLLHIVGMLYTADEASGWTQLEKKGAFFLIPVTLLATTWLGSSRQLLMKAFVLACLAATLVCVVYAVWSAMTGSTHQNFGPYTMAEFLRLNPGASMIWMNFSYVTLASGIGIHPTYFGVYLSLCLLILIYQFQNDMLTLRERKVSRVIFMYIIVFIFFLSSRMVTIVAVVISLSAIVLMSRKPWPRVVLRMIAGMVLFALIVYANPVSRYRDLQEPVAASMGNVPDYATTSVDIRLSLLRLSKLASNEVNPWIGAGTGAGEGLLRAEGEARGISNVIGSFDPHNQFIYTFFELGIAGLIAVICVLFIPAWYAWRRKSYLLAGFTLIIAVVCLAESALELQKGIILYAFFGSLLLFDEAHPSGTAG